MFRYQIFDLLFLEVGVEEFCYCQQSLSSPGEEHTWKESTLIVLETRSATQLIRNRREKLRTPLTDFLLRTLRLVNDYSTDSPQVKLTGTF